jgi:hypothetical protein
MGQTTPRGDIDKMAPTYQGTDFDQYWRTTPSTTKHAHKYNLVRSLQRRGYDPKASIRRSDLDDLVEMSVR